MKLETVVVGYDGSPNAREAIERAIDLTAIHGVVHVVTAVDPAEVKEMVRVRARLPEELRNDFDPVERPSTILHEAMAALGAAGVAHEGHLVEDDPATAILEVAAKVDAEIIVVGSRGLRHGTRFLRGSVSSRICTHAHTSFLVVHHEPST
jgi:nucleotide-binding universal stress UspA family protein